MDHIVVAMGIEMAFVFGLGVILGCTAMIALAVRKEDRGYTLTGQAPGIVARGVRRLTGVGVRDIIVPPETWRGRR